MADTIDGPEGGTPSAGWTLDLYMVRTHTPIHGNHRPCTELGIQYPTTAETGQRERSPPKTWAGSTIWVGAAYLFWTWDPGRGTGEEQPEQPD